MTRNRIQREVQGLASTLPPEIQVSNTVFLNGSIALYVCYKDI